MVTQQTPGRHLMNLTIGYWASQCVYTAAKLDIAEHIAEGRVTSARIAAAAGAHRESLHRLLRFLAGIGVLAGDDERGFALTPSGELLRPGVPGSMRDLVVLYGEEFYQAWGQVLHTVRTGQLAFEHVFGSGMYPYFAAHPDSARLFDGAMAAGTSFFAEVPRAFDFTRAETVVDIGGGNGALLSEVLLAHPHTRGVLFDVAHVVAAAREDLAGTALADRVTYVAGDYREEIPPGGDVYLLSRILHGRDDQACLDLLDQCHRAMPPGATLIALERMIPPSGESTLGLWFDMQMLAVAGGIERDGQEYRALLDKSGFEPRGVEPLALDMFAIVAERR